MNCARNLSARSNVTRKFTAARSPVMPPSRNLNANLGANAQVFSIRPSPKNCKRWKKSSRPNSHNAGSLTHSGLALLARPIIPAARQTIDARYPGPMAISPIHSERGYRAGPLVEISYTRFDPLISARRPSDWRLVPNKLNGLRCLRGMCENSAPGQFFR